MLTFRKLFILKALAIVSNSSVEDKLNWAFRLYDLNNNGVISKQEMLTVFRSVYSLVKNSEVFQDEIQNETIDTRVDRVFDLIDEVLNF